MRVFKHIFAVLVCQLLILSTVFAHVQDMYNADRVFEIRLGEGFVDLRLLFGFKEFPSLAERLEMDTDTDNLISETEARNYAEKYLRKVISEVELTKDGRKLILEALKEPQLDLYGRLRVVPQHQDLTIELASQVNFPENKYARLRFRLLEQKPWPHPGKQIFALVAAREFAVDSTSLDGLTRQVEPGVLRNISFVCRRRSGSEIEKAAAEGEGNWRIVRFAQSYNLQQIAAASKRMPEIGRKATVLSESGTESSDRQDRKLREMLIGYLEGSAESKTNLWIILAMAFIYGCIHALAPGHAKTLTAAYLVGSRHRWPHALVLAGVVTLTHTGSILVLAIISKLAWGDGLGAGAQAILTGLSGLIVLVLGIQRLRGGTLHYPNRHHQHHNGNDYNLKNDGYHNSRGIDRTSPEKGSYPQIFWLGFAGGLAPCPGAIWIYFLALGFGRPGLGVALIISLSLGLALVLVAVGLATIYFRNLLGRKAGSSEQGRDEIKQPPFLKKYMNRILAALPTIAGTALVIIGSFLIWRSLSSLGLI